MSKVRIYYRVLTHTASPVLLRSLQSVTVLPIALFALPAYHTVVGMGEAKKKIVREWIKTRVEGQGCWSCEEDLRMGLNDENNTWENVLPVLLYGL